jgi:very-short-patch-repair endonuclease
MTSTRLDLQIEDWRKRLLDLSKRNRLINCKVGARAAIEVAHPDAEAVWQQVIVNDGTMSFAWKHDLLDEEPEKASQQLSLFLDEGEDQSHKKAVDSQESPNNGSQASPNRSEMEECLASPHLRDDDILTQLADRALASRLSRLSLNAKTAIAEQGINILYLGFGLLRWYESPDSDAAFFAPLLLVPVELDRAGPDAPWHIRAYEEEVVPNYSLRELLSTNYRLTLPDIPDNGLENPGERAAFLQAVADLVQGPESHSRWEVQDRVILGPFSFQKLAMWQDLGNNRERIASHDLCRSIAGDLTASVSNGGDLPSPSDFDERVHPKDVHSILDADGSQLEAILATKTGMNLILDGPPGTGKSQTIANIIAESLAAGQTVLFVSEKAAALEVVKRRLDGCNLGDFCLECHSHKANKKEVIAELGRCLELPGEKYRDQKADLERLHSLRQRLNLYVRALHRQHGALNLATYVAHGRLARIKVQRESRCPIRSVLRIDADTLREIEDQLQGLCESRNVIKEHDQHPWRGCQVKEFSLTQQEDIRQDFELLAREITLRADAMAILAGHGLCPPNSTRTDLQAALAHTERVLEYPELPEGWFANNPRDIASRLVELHATQVQCQEVWKTLSAYRPEVVNTATDRLVNDVSDQGDPWVARVRAPLPRTVGFRRAWLDQLAEDLTATRRLVEDIRISVDEYSRAIRTRIDSTSTLGILDKLNRLGNILAHTGLLKTSWFDDTKRAELQLVGNKCQKETEAADVHRQSLSKRLASNAFGSEGAALAEAAIQFEPFWSRTWSRITGEWGRFARSCAALYDGGLPQRPGDVFSDMQRLRQYHAHMRVLHEEEQTHSADLLFDEQGRARWDDFAAGIDAIHRLRSIINISDRLKLVLTTEGLLDHSALETATNQLATRLAELNSRVAMLNQRFAMTNLGVGRTTHLDLSPEDFLKWLHEAEKGIRSHVAALDAILGLLKTGADVVLAELPTHFARIGELRNLQGKADDLYADLKAFGVLASLGPESDLTTLVETAHQVIRFVDAYGDVPQEELVQIVTKRETRSSVEAAYQQLLTLFQGRGGQAWRTLETCFPSTEPVSSGVVIDRTPLDRLAVWLRHQVGVVHRLQEWIRFRESEAALGRLGVMPVLHEVLSQEIPLEQAYDAFLARFYRLWLDEVYRNDTVLREFSVQEHEKQIAMFRQLDREAIQGAYKRIRAKLLEAPDRPHSGMLSAPPSSELGLLMREVSKRKRHMPLRQLFRRIPTLLPRLKPCVMMSPLAVSTYLDSPDLTFDLVIFDEASQVRPYDAIGAIYRGRQIIVAGDQKQLPPTSFFDRLASDDEYDDSDEEDDVSNRLDDFESILDVCCSIGMPRKRLRWHYRSRREPLIAFSNHHFYGNELATFPSVFDADSTTAVQFHYVQNGRWRPGSGGGDNPVEARETALLVFRLFEEHPDQSLGVITFNQRQQFAVLDELERLRRGRPEVEEFFKEGREEPFFVKNLENVQGDERDRIILSVGYAYDEHGKFAMRFGPLNVQGGERRLNVAVTRAKNQVILVSSIRANDIDLSRAHSDGARLLRAYIDYADRGVDALGSEIREDGVREADSVFEEQVEYALRQRGLDVRRQVGCSGFRIDLAIVDPTRKGRYVLGVECDGASYHSSATARDRDRLRQDILEGLGWKICRVWSTDWIRNPESQVRRIVEAYEQALKAGVGLKPGEIEPRSFDEERPALRIRTDDTSTDRPTCLFSSIDEVPMQALRTLIVNVLRRYGQTTTEELVKTVAHDLGFQRAGKRISARIGEEVASLIKVGAVRQADGDRLYVA